MLQMANTGLSDLEQAGAIQRFEFCWELAWKSIRDYLAEAGAPTEVPTPINVIRSAMQVDLISNGDGWVGAMQTRNMLSHEYNASRAAESLQKIATEFLPLFTALRTVLEGQRAKGN